MSATLVGTVTRCPLCGEGLDTPGRLAGGAPHAVLFRRQGHGGGILLCDDCATLAELPATLPLN